jgi:hypothetical protein
MLRRTSIIFIVVMVAGDDNGLPRRRMEVIMV